MIAMVYLDVWKIVAVIGSMSASWIVLCLAAFFWCEIDKSDGNGIIRLAASVVCCLVGIVMLIHSFWLIPLFWPDMWNSDEPPSIMEREAQ